MARLRQSIFITLGLRPLDLVVYFLSSAFLLLIFNSNALLGFYSQKLLGDRDVAPHAFGSGIQTFLNYIDRQTGLRLPIFIVWAILAILVYLFFWLMSNLYINIHNDIAAQDFVHSPKKTSDYWRPIIWHKLMFGVSLVVCLIFAILAPSLAAKISNLFYLNLVGDGQNQNLLGALADVLCLSGLIYVALTLIKAVRQSWFTIQNGL